RVLHETGVRDGTLDDLEPGMRREVVSAAGRVVVDDENLVAPREETIDQVRADEARPSRHEHLHVSASLSRSSRNRPASAWYARCHSSSERSPQILRPKRGSFASCSGTKWLLTRSLSRAAREAKTSHTKSRTGPGRASHSCNGTGKPILSRRLATASGRTSRSAALS